MNFALATGSSTGIPQLIDYMALVQPDFTYLVCAENGQELTFKELQTRAKRLYIRFRKLGLGQGDKVAFLMDNSVSSAELFLGAIYGGFVAVPLNVRAGVSQLSYMLEHSDAKIVIVGEKYNSLIDEILTGVTREVQVISGHNEAFPNLIPDSDPADGMPRPRADDPALLMYSSGTTGQPKGAIHTHRSILAHGRNSIVSHQLTSTDRSLLVLPLYHINAECVTLIPTLMSGGSVVIPRGFVVSEFWSWLDDYRCTWSALVPTIISQLLDWKDPKADSRASAFQRIRFLRSSSAPLSPALHREFLDKFKLPLIQAMGSSEAGNVFSNPVPPGVNKIGSPGLAWGFEAKIVDREGNEAHAQEPGEVLLRGDGMMQGYYKDPVGTAAVMDAGGWLHTGDLAYQDEDGYFFVVGRSKELIIRGGMNIAPKQIDEVLESHPAVLEAAAVGVPDRYVGEDVVAFAVLRDRMACDERELLNFCESRLGHFKTPTRIHFVRDLPKGPSGKVQRLRLQEEATERSALSGAATRLVGHSQSDTSVGTIAPSTPIEQLIAETWAQMLELPRVDLQSNFFSLGGHSLLAIKCLSALRDKLPVRLSLADFFENATVADQAALVRRRLGSTVSPSAESTGSWEQELLQKAGPPPADETIPLRDRSLPCPLSLNQQRIWFMEEVSGGEPVYNEAEAVRLRGQLNVKLLESALNVIVSRHEILRTTIETVNEEPTAAVHETWSLRLKQIDLSSLPPGQREAEVERLLIDEPRLPFRLGVQPGIRVTLLRLGQTEHVIILMMHHIVCDWASLGVFWRDLSALYRAGRRGQPLELPALPVEHGDYAAWQQQLLSRGEFAEDLVFWQETLRGAPALLDLPTDRPRPPVFSYRGAKRRFQIPVELALALRDCSQREKVSLFTLFASALDTLLYRYTGQEDILLGIPLADRDRPELQSLIGFLLHTHVLRARLSGELSFRELLLRVQKGVLDLYAHRSPPFDEVVSKIQPERNPSYSPLFQVMLNWRDGDQQPSFIGLDSIEIESVLAESRTAKFDLTLMLTDGGDNINLEVEYSTDLFDEARINRMVGHFNTLLQAAAANPDRRLSDLPLLTEAERQQLLVEWNRTEASYPKDRCLHQLFEEQVERTPDATAVVFEDKQLTYRQLNERANRLARHLQKLSVGPDALVAICMERSLEMVEGLLGILKAGGAYLPLDPTYPRERLAYMLRDSGALLLLTQERLRSQFDMGSLNSRVLCVDADRELFSGSLNETPTCVAGPENLAYVIYTSGSTGDPKGVEIRHRNLVNVLYAMAKELGFGQKDKLLAVTTISFDIAGLELFLPLIAGGQVELAPTSELRDGFALGQRLERSGATVMQATPTTWTMLIEAGWSGNRSLRVLCGGEAITPTLAEVLATRAREIWNVYGPTETTIWSSFDRIRAGEPITIGRPIANTQFYIVDREGEPVPIGVPGELLIGGDGLARGYFRRPELTAERFIANRFVSHPAARLYKTGDLVRHRADGSIQWLGRLDHQVKIRGLRIELGEIESVLATHAAVREAVVQAREDAPGDKRLVAYVTVSKAAPNEPELRALLRSKLPEYMIPSAFVVLDHLPLTPNGKVDRKALPRPDVQWSDPVEFATAETETQRTLADIWRQILRIERIGLHDNFFEVGGHSLLLARMVQKINSFFEIKLAVVEVFENPTVAQLTRVVNERRSGRQQFVLCLRGGQAKTPLYFLSTGPDEARMAKLIGGERPVYGIQIPWPTGWHQIAKDNRVSSFPSMEQFASLFVKTLYEHLGTGPCILAGHCFAGLLAFEAARQFQTQGGKVESVVVIDRQARPMSVYRMAVSNLRQCWSRMGADQGRLTCEGFAGRINRSAFILRWFLGQQKWQMEKGLGLWVGELTPTVDSEGVPVGTAVLMRFYRRLHQRYRPERLDCRGIVIRTAFIDNYQSVRWADEQMGWSGLFSKGIEAIELTGDHSSMIYDKIDSLSLASAITEAIATC